MEHVWRLIHKAMFGTESTRQLTKEQPSPIHATIERELAEKHGLDQIPWPHLEHPASLPQPDYPQMEAEPKF